MPESALGVLLRNLRERRQFSYRELAQLADLDHAYIFRLETGSKESPSSETLQKLGKALKSDKRDNDILHYLAEHPDTSPALAALAVEDPTLTYGEFTAAAGMAYRGTARQDYRKLLERIRRYAAEDDDG